jgi:subtilisin family serine protease
VIVNLSLMLDIPASHKLVQRWFPGLSGPPDDAVLQAALDTLDESIRAPIDALSRQGVLVIAAAGNDALPVAFGVPTRPLPRFPARIESVLSVAAAKRDGTPASYSNLATVPPQSSFGPATTNGIAVLGGEAALHSGWWGPPPSPQNPPVPGLPALFGPRFLDLASVPGPPDAIVGIASAQRLALARVTNPTSGTLPPPNTTGWSYWTGTSFATPVATALAATLWELDPALPSSDILGMVRSFARAPATGLGCNLLEVQQT